MDKCGTCGPLGTKKKNGNGNGICLPTEHLKSAQELISHVSVHSGSNWNLAVLVFEECGKLGYAEKNLRAGKNQQKTQPTNDAGNRIKPRSHWGGGGG